MLDSKKRIKKINECYDPVLAIRYHFTEFGVVAGFFVAITGGLFAAYFTYGYGNKVAGIVIPSVGYVIAFLFFWCSKTYNLCFDRFSSFLEEDFDESIYKEFSRPLKYAKTKITRIISFFSYVLTYIWLALLMVIIYTCIAYTQLPISQSCIKFAGIVAFIILAVCNAFFLCCFCKCLQDSFNTEMKKSAPKKDSKKSICFE